MEKPILLWGTIILSSLSVFIIPLIKFNHLFIARDWTLYNCLSYFTQSSWLYNKTIPHHNPYVLGGYDIIASPQSKVFSPLTIYDFLFSAPYASLFSLLTLSILGCFGMYKLLCFLKIEKLPALFCALIYAHASWFSLHFSEGHVVFGSFQLMSVVLYFTFNLTKATYKVYLAALLAFMVLDGGMYAFIYSIIVVIFAYIFRLNSLSFKALIKSVNEQFFQSIFALFIFIGLAGAKIIPLLIIHHDRTSIKENILLDMKSILHAFFNPNQYLHLKIPNANFYEYGIKFHEVGAYIGILSGVIILIYLVTKFQRKYIPYLLFMGLFFWVGTGIGYKFNPWSLFQEIPIISNAHIQTRALFLVYFTLIILLGFSLNYFLNCLNKTTFLAIVFLLTIEALIIPNIAFYKVYQHEESLSNSNVFNSYLKNTTVEKTISTPGSGWGKDFELFENKNIASRGFIDNAVTQGEIKTITDKDYMGEAYFLLGKGSVQVNSYTPNGLVIKIKTNEPSEIQFNTNFLSNWRSSNDKITVYDKNGLLTIHTDKIDEIITLKYSPDYLKIILPCYIISFLSLLVFFSFRKRKLSNYFP